MPLYIIYLSNPCFELLKTSMRKNMTGEKTRGLPGDPSEACRKRTGDYLG
jgi:hypothetical protein